MRYAARTVLALTLLLVPALVLACGGGEDTDDERIAGVIHRLLLAAGTEGTELLESFPGALPEDLPVDPPLYPGAELLVSNRQPAPVSDPGGGEGQGDVPQPLLYFIVLDTTDSREDVFTFYEEALNEDPWQLQSTFSTAPLDTLQFVNVEDLDLGGVVSIARGGDDDRTSVLISLQDAGASLEEAPEFVLQSSLATPAAFPEDIPLFDGGTVTGTAYFREPGVESFLLVFLTTSNQDEVIDFYREAFQSIGWTVQDTEAFGLEGSIDFRDEAGEVQGNVFANRFPRDRQYTEVSIQVQQDPAREIAEPGEGEAEAPTAVEEVETPTG